MEAGKCESLVTMYGNLLGRNRKVTSGTDKRRTKKISKGTENPDLEGNSIDYGGNDAIRSTFEVRT